MKRVLLVLTSHDRMGQGPESPRRTGFWLSEVTHFCEILTAAGFEVDFVSPRGGRAPMDERSLDLRDDVNRAFMEDPDLSSRIATTLSPRSVRATDYDVIYFVGGHGALWDFPGDANLQLFTRSVYERGGIVAAGCHGVAALLEVTLTSGERLVDGRTLTAFTNDEETLSLCREHVPFLLESELVARGATFRRTEPFTPHVEVNGRLVTGQNPQSSSELAEAVVETFHRAVNAAV